jgi:hypothetical protein
MRHGTRTGSFFTTRHDSRLTFEVPIISPVAALLTVTTCPSEPLPRMTSLLLSAFQSALLTEKSPASVKLVRNNVLKITRITDTDIPVRDLFIRSSLHVRVKCMVKMD